MFLKSVAAILGFCFLTMSGAALAVYHAGVLVVNVNDKREGTHIFVPVPMLMADFGLLFVPKDAKMRIHDELGKHRELAVKMTKALADCPDGVFVEVEDPEDTVIIKKSGDDFIVDVKSKEENVYLKMPIAPTGRILSKLSEIQ